MDRLARLGPEPDGAANSVSQSYNKPTNMLHWPGSSSRACSKTPRLGLHWQDLPELHVGEPRSDTDVRYAAVQSPRETDYKAAHRRWKNRREGALWDPFELELVRAQQASILMNA